MLCLKRKPGEEIQIGPDIRMRVNYIDGNAVSLGFIAPRDVTIVRTELLKQPPAPSESSGTSPEVG